MRKAPSLKMQCCLCTLTLLLQSLILCSCVSDALLLFLWCSAALSLVLYSCNFHCHLPDTLLHLHWAPTHFWTFWHMSMPKVQEEKEGNLQNRGELIKKKRCTEQIARQTSALGCPTSLQSSKWPYIQSRSIWSGFHCAKSDENKAINILTDDWCN